MARTDSGAAPVGGPGPRLGAFLVDVAASSLIAFVFTAPELPQNRSLAVFAVLYFAGTLFVQQTPGMRLLRLRVVRIDGPVPVGLWRSAVRTLGVVLVVPAVLRDRDGRALHDRLTQTAVVTAPRSATA